MSAPPAPSAPAVHPAYRPDIDGLRAVAVLAVVFFHASPHWLPGGFVGVDIFFVISGFLISTIIFGSLAGRGFSYADFYARRIRRIFPSLLLVMAATLAFGWYGLLADEFRQLGKHVLAAAGFVSNFALWSEAGYFDTAAESKPLLHLWSLAVEEQFYIFWPLLLGAAWALRGRPLLRWMVVAALLSFAVNVALTWRHPEAAFYMPLARVWELAAGAVLAWLALHGRLPATPGVRNAISVAGLLMIAAGLALIHRHQAFPGYWALLPVLGTCLAIAAGPQAWLNRRLLGSRAAVWVGLISYPLYLWHWPLLAYARVLENGIDPPRAVRFGAVALSVLLAWLSYRFVERPLRHRPGRAVVGGLAGAMGGLALLGALALAHLWGPRHAGADLQAVVAAGADWTYPDGMQPVEAGGQTFQGVGQGPGTALLIGDSNVEQYGPRAVALARQAPRRARPVVFATRGACPPIPGLREDRDPLCVSRLDAALALARTPQIDTVVIGGCWPCYFDVGPAASAPAASAPPAPDHYYYLDAAGQRHPLRGGDGVARSLKALDQLLRDLRAAGKTTYLLLSMPVGEGFEPRERLVGNRLQAMHVSAVTPRVRLSESQQDLHERMVRLGREAGAVVLDPLSALCDAAMDCLRTDVQGAPIYKDATHLRAGYVREAASWLDAALLRP